MSERDHRRGRRDLGSGRRGCGRATSLALGLLLLAAAAGPAGAQELPGGFELSGGVYLYHYQPLELEGVEANSEIYALYLNVDRSEGPWELHLQGRWRDTKLRDFFPSTTWLQEAWGSYRAPLGPDAALTLKAGKLYQRLGRFWDGSFFGNLPYFDGLKLDPDVGVEASLRTPLGGAGAEAELWAQGLVDSDRINGALADRDLEGEEDRRERGVAGGLRVAAPVARPGGRELRLAVGVSGLVERVEATAEAEAPEASATLPHAAVDVEARWGPAVAYAEWTRRASGGLSELGRLAGEGGAAAAGPAGSRATWWLTGVRVDAGPVELRYNLSTARYGDGGFRETIHQPGVTLEMANGISLLVEYDDWDRGASGPDGSASRPPGAPPVEARLDRSLNVVLHLTF